MRRFACLIAFVALAAPGSASAHANLVRTVPADGAVLAAAPSLVVVLFDDVVRVGPGNEAVRNGGASILAGKPRTHGKTLVLPVRAGIGHGAFSVRWSVISDDGHEERGVLAFAVGAGQPSPVATLRAGGEVGFRTVLTRWLFFAGLLVAAGLALFDVAVWRPVVRGGITTGWMAIGLAAVFVSATGLVHGTHAGTSTRFGLVIELSAVVAAAGATAAAIAVVDRTAAPFGLVLALALLPGPTLAGHSLDPGRSWVDAPIDFLHVLAAAFWVGGLVALTLVVGRTGAPPELATAAARRFSRLTLVAVLVIAATGAGRALAELSSVSQLWSTGYGRAIVIKTVLFAVLVLLGWVSRSRLAAGYARVHASVALELGVVLGLLVAVGALTALPPGRRAPFQAAAAPVPTSPTLPPPNATALAQRDGELAVTIAVHSGTVAATFIGPDGRTASVGLVTVDGRSAHSCGNGCYTATLTRSNAVTVAHAGRTLRFELGLQRPVAGLIAKATRIYRRQRSVVFRERLASGLGGVVNTLWTEVAPNELSYRIAHGSSAIIIGTRRWDRDPGDVWRASPSTLLRMPAPTWGFQPVQNARLLRSDASTYVVSFVSAGPAWFTVVLDRRTLLPRTVDMVAAAHFMHERYISFGKPIELRPPH